MDNTYDIIICGAGSAGCVIARRLSDDPNVSILLIEAGGADQAPSVHDPARWAENLESERDWRFVSEPNPHLCGRTLPLAMGKVLGGGSSINALQWARGHKQDWDDFAEAAGDSEWGFESVSRLYSVIEARGGMNRGGVIPIASAASFAGETPILVEAADAIGIPIYDSPNGKMTEGVGGASVLETIMRGGQRQSVYRSYLHPIKGRPNLTIATETLVTRIVFEGRRAAAVEIKTCEGQRRISASCEIILCLGAVNTPKLLIQSGIGPAAELDRLGVPVVQDHPGVGQNFQDHLLLFGCSWGFARKGVIPNLSRAVLQWRSRSILPVPDMQIQQSNGGTLKAEMRARGLTPESWWSLAPALIQPQSRGYLRVTGPNPDDPVQIFGNYLDEPQDLRVLMDGIALCRELASSSALRGNIGRELLPGRIAKDALENFVRRRVGTFWHQACSAKMGRDRMSVVNARLQVYGVDGLRIADASILPRITAGNTMGPCVVIGEKAAAFVVSSMH